MSLLYSLSDKSAQAIRQVSAGAGMLETALKGAALTLQLSEEQILFFVEHTPEGKNGPRLWAEFLCREGKHPPREYTFISFVLEVLREAGKPWKAAA